MDIAAVEHSVAPAISLCVHVRNRLQFLVPCLESILKQSYQHFELVIVDYGCSQHSYEYVTANYQDHRIKVFKYDDRLKPWTMATSKNLAILNSTGEIVILIDCDNVLDPDFLKCHVELYLHDRQSFYYGGAQHPGHDAVLPFGLTMLRKEDFIRAGGFNEICTYGWGREDVDLVARLCNLGLQCKGFLNLIRAIEHSDELRNKQARIKSIIETNNLNFIASSIGFKSHTGDVSFSRTFTTALEKTGYFSGLPVELISFAGVEIIYQEYIYNKTYQDRSIRSFLYSLTLHYQCNGTFLSSDVYVYSKVKDKERSNYRRDPKDYLSFEHVFCSPSGVDQEANSEFVSFRNKLHGDILKQNYYRTIYMLDKADAGLMEGYLSAHPLKKNRLDILEGFSVYLNEAIGRLSPAYREQVTDALLLENKILETEKIAAVIPEPLEVELNRLKEEVMKLDGVRFMDAELILSPAVITGKTRWDWSANAEDAWAENYGKAPAFYPFLISNYNYAVAGDTIPASTCEIFAAFGEVSSVKKAVQACLKRAGDDSTEAEWVQRVRDAFEKNLLITRTMLTDFLPL